MSETDIVHIFNKSVLSVQLRESILERFLTLYMKLYNLFYSCACSCDNKIN